MIRPQGSNSDEFSYHLLTTSHKEVAQIRHSAAQYDRNIFIQSLQIKNKKDASKRSTYQEDDENIKSSIVYTCIKL